MSSVSLLDGPLPTIVKCAAVVIVGALAWGWRKHWRTLCVLIVATTVTAVVVSWLFNLPHELRGTFPKSFFLWVALPVAVGVATAVLWRSSRLLQQVSGVIAVPLLVLFVGAQVNAFYGYLPTVGSIFGVHPTGEVSSLKALDQLDPTTGSAKPNGHGTSNNDGRPNRPLVMRDRGVVVPLDFPATVSHFAHRPGYVWLPPVWFVAPRPALSVLMLLNGTPGRPSDWFGLPDAATLANHWAKTHRGYAPILVIPDPNGSILGDSECVDSRFGNAETYLSVDVVNFVKQRFKPATVAKSWGVAGLSEGGTCAVELALRHPEIFGAFGDYSGNLGPTIGSRSETIKGLYGGNATEWMHHDPTWILHHQQFPTMHGWFEAGDNDPTRQAVDKLAELCRKAGMDVVRRATRGRHDFYTWRQAFHDSYPWLVARLQP